MKVAVYRHVDTHGQAWDLLVDPQDVDHIATPSDMIDLTKPGERFITRELGRAHLHLTFKEGARPEWVPAPASGGE